jgi:hypothetical protein
MNSLEIAPQELRRLLEHAAGLAGDYWESLSQRPAFPKTSAQQLEQLFAPSVFGYAEETMQRSCSASSSVDGFTFQTQPLMANSRYVPAL